MPVAPASRRPTDALPASTRHGVADAMARPATWETTLPRSEEKSSRRSRKADFADKSASPEATMDADSDEALPDIEDAEDVAAEEDETFLEEEEEEGGDVSNIIGGPVDEGDEER